MTTKNKMTGFALATAAAAAFVLAPVVAFADDPNPSANFISCASVNSCKGQSSCKSANNACKNLNKCKGQGLTTIDEKSCKDEGGTVQ